MCGQKTPGNPAGVQRIYQCGSLRRNSIEIKTTQFQTGFAINKLLAGFGVFSL